MFFCFSSCKLWWFSDIQKGSSIVRHFKKEIQEIWKPSNKHPVKLLRWEPFGVLWSPMTPTERTVGSRTAKAFRKCHAVARDAFIKRPYKFPFWGYDRLEKLKKCWGQVVGTFAWEKHKSSLKLSIIDIYFVIYMDRRLQSNFWGTTLVVSLCVKQKLIANSGRGSSIKTQHWLRSPKLGGSCKYTPERHRAIALKLYSAPKKVDGICISMHLWKPTFS